MVYEEAASQLLRALRGRRSQIAFARRLGYVANPICDWEHGRRFPTAVEALRAARIAGADPAQAFARFATREIGPPSSLDPEGLSVWLRSLKGRAPLAEVAERAGASRFAVSRWLAGKAQPRLPDFLRLLHALTRRAADWVALLVPIDQVPALRPEFDRRATARRLAGEVPWSEAVLRVLETTGYGALPAHDDAWVGARLGVAAEVVAGCVTALTDAGVVRGRDRRLVAAEPLTVDTRGATDLVARLKTHWAGVARDRAAEPRAGDLLSYNVVSLSRADLERLRQLHLAYYRDVRALVAASEPVEVAALVQVQLVTFDLP